jgi:hypothetical protein
VTAIELASGAVGYAHVQTKSGRKHLFKYPLEREWLCRSILQGRYNSPLTEADGRVRRVLDIGAGEGAFAVHAWIRWPGAWVDWYEPDERLAKFALENAVPGSRRLRELPDSKVEYDVVRYAMPLGVDDQIVITDWLAT